MIIIRWKQTIFLRGFAITANSFNWRPVSPALVSHGKGLPQTVAQIGGVEAFLDGFNNINLAQMLAQHKAFRGSCPGGGKSDKAESLWCNCFIGIDWSLVSKNVSGDDHSLLTTLEY